MEHDRAKLENTLTEIGVKFYSAADAGWPSNLYDGVVLGTPIAGDLIVFWFDKSGQFSNISGP